MPNHNPTPTVPVPRDVVTDALWCVQTLELKSNFGMLHEGETEADTAEFRNMNKHINAKAKESIAALESALAAPAADGWEYDLSKAEEGYCYSVSATWARSNEDCVFEAQCGDDHAWYGGEDFEDKLEGLRVYAFRPLPSPAPKPEAV